MAVLLKTHDTNEAKPLPHKRVTLDGRMYRLQNSYVYYKLESKATSNFYVTSKKLGCFEKKIYD